MKTVIYLDKRLFSCLDLTQDNCQTVISYFLSVPNYGLISRLQK